MFVDACGWGVVEPRGWFLGEGFHHRQAVESLFGYSSACVPAILSGRKPNENGHWSSFYYSPQTSPFRPLKYLDLLPGRIVDRGRVRRYLSYGIARSYGFTGYFQIYNVPFGVLPYFDYAEKRDIFRPGGINEGPSIFDWLASERVPHHVSNWRHSERTNIQSLKDAVHHGEIEFAFLYTASLDGLMHEQTKDSPRVDDKLRWYEAQVRELLQLATRRYDDVRFALFSDHGMCTVEHEVDLVPRVEGTGLAFGVDFAAMYDSTMMRFWFLREGAEARIRDALPDDAHGRWLTDHELKRYGTFWEDRKFGDAIYALEPGYLLCPCHMGNTPMRGMHGYRPDHEDSYSALLANFTPDTEVQRITDLYALMTEMAGWAHTA